VARFFFGVRACHLIKHKTKCLQPAVTTFYTITEMF